MPFFLGVDAGNTKTIAVIADENGTIHGIGRSGCGDIYGAESPDTAIAIANEAITSALQMANVRKEELEASGFSMAGADWPEDFTFLEEQFKNLQYNNISIVNDAIGGLRSGTNSGKGVSVILGTGVAIGACGIENKIWHGSFWIQSIGSRELVKETIKAVVNADLGISEPTNLTTRVLDIYQKEKVDEFLYAITCRDGRMEMKNSKIISALIYEAGNNDSVARHILQNFAVSCAEYAIIAAKKVDFSITSSFDVVYSGGLFHHPSTLLFDLIKQPIDKEFKNVNHILSKVEPIIGALYQAYNSENITVSEQMTNRLIQTMPDVSFFTTA
ncbi:N-acetylglucosamine kinase-like BadF-type ATPase [Scopulibacillus darangshiensis]|uniref:N-acetylglucosamine kinase-like BadF-type ATPase n=1 Tax=Scopulibacillus darangshiensis TaxID=442528 RepID=A0A4R2P9S2_9BACL|nr:BadF/BadG/BcrA/BcrD ATPase family protein [Scopulibacillus darangshiensis]TCP30974.1 N-acetylglucosamine kinase-like BadF-type ATPase [Scopulibacillus darangshiensis]